MPTYGSILSPSLLMDMELTLLMDIELLGYGRLQRPPGRSDSEQVPICGTQPMADPLPCVPRVHGLSSV